MAWFNLFSNTNLWVAKSVQYNLLIFVKKAVAFIFGKANTQWCHTCLFFGHISCCKYHVFKPCVANTTQKGF